MLAFDAPIFLWINAGPATPAWCVHLAQAVCNVIPAIAVAAMVAVAIGRPAWRSAVFRALAAMVLAWLIVSVLRTNFPMPRPGQLGLGIQWASQGARPGFPSMHTTIMFTFAMALMAGGLRGAAWLMVALAVAVGWCRIVLGLHFPSDVLAGALLGTALGWGVGWPRHQRVWPVGPGRRSVAGRLH